jgi:hypothetical protein
MLQQRIGDFRFLALLGPVAPPAMRVEPVARPGIDGAAYWMLGRLGEPFILRSQVDAGDLISAQSLFEQYVLLKGEGPQTLIKDDLDFTAAASPWKVKILEVRLVACRRIAASVGGLNPPSLAMLEADWQLQAVEL